MFTKVVLILLLIVSFGYSKDNYWDRKGRLIVNEKSLDKMIQVPKRADIKTVQKKYSKSEIQKFHDPADSFISTTILMSVDKIYLLNSSNGGSDNPIEKKYDSFLFLDGKVLETYKGSKKARFIAITKRINLKNIKTIQIPRYVLVNYKTDTKDRYSNINGKLRLDLELYDSYDNKTYAYYPFESMEAVKEFKKAFKLKAQ